MDRNNEGRTIYPPAEFAPAAEAVQVKRPAWESQLLSKVVDQAEIERQGTPESRSESTTLLQSIEPIEPNHEMLHVADITRDSTKTCAIVGNPPGHEFANNACCERNDVDDLDYQRSKGSHVHNLPQTEGSPPGDNRTLGHSGLNHVQTDDGQGIINDFSKTVLTTCAGGGDLAAVDTSKERGTSYYGDLQDADLDGDTKPNVNRDSPKSKSAKHAAAEQCSRQSGGSDGFRALLEAAIRENDAERAQGRESAKAMGRSGRSTPHEHCPEDKPGPTTTELMSSVITSSDNSTSDCDQAEHTKSDTACSDNVANIVSESIALRLPCAPPTAQDPKTERRQWVRYLSPEGYAYLYDEVTGESKWVIPDEGDEKPPQAQEMTHTTMREAKHKETEVLGDDVVNRDGRTDVRGTGNLTTEERDPPACSTGSNSVGACEISQWCEDISGPDARNSAGETAMHLAAAQCSPRGLSLLLGSGANANTSDYKGRTPLHAVCAICHGNSDSGNSNLVLECVELLLLSGAQKDARDSKGQTALHLAVLAGNAGTVRALLAVGATPMADDDGNSPLHLAAAHGHSDIIQSLIVGNRDESSPKRPTSFEMGVRTRDRSTADHRSRHPAFVGLSTGGQRGENFCIGKREGTSPVVGEDAVTVDGLVVGAAKSHVQYFGSGNEARTIHSKTLGEGSEDGYLEWNSPLPFRGQEAPTLTDGPPSYNENRACGTASPSLKPDPIRLEYRLRRQTFRGNFQHIERGMSSGLDSFFETYRRKAGGHQGLDPEQHRRSGGNRENRQRIRQSRRRHTSERENQTCCWAEPLSPHEYAQTIRAAIVGGGDGSRAPSQAALAAALFAACLASRPNDAAAVLRLLEVEGSGIASVRDENERTPLHHVCRANDVGMVRLLCQAGADTSARDYQGSTSLAVAAARGSAACLQLLLRAGSDPDCSNDAGETPLHLAVRFGNLSCVKILVEAGATLSRRNTLGLTPKEDLLDSELTFTRGRLPKALRTTLEYLEHAEALAGKPRCSTLTEHPESEQEWEKQRGLHVGAEGSETLSEGGVSSCSFGDHVGGWSEGRGADGDDGARRKPDQIAAKVEKQANDCTLDRSSNNISEKGLPSNAVSSSGIRSGVWSIVGRAIGSLVSVVSGNGGDHPDRCESVLGGGSCGQDRLKHGNRRPPTDAELEARVSRPPSFERRPEQTSEVASRLVGASASATAASHPVFDLAPTAEQLRANIPIYLTPMQPPPDVLAVMKGRQASGQRRPRISAPPTGVAEVLKETRVQRKHSRGPSCHGAGRGEYVSFGGDHSGPTNNSSEHV